MSTEYYNKLEVSGPSLAAFTTWLNGRPLSFNTIVPLPKELPRDKHRKRTQAHSDVLIGRYGVDNLDDWIYANWGTREIGYWGDSPDANGNTDNYFISNQDAASVMYFMTCNGVPIPAIKTLSAMFSDLNFDLSYICPGYACAGICRIINGTDTYEAIAKKDPRFRAIGESFADEKAGIYCDMELVVSGPRLNDFGQWLGESPLSLDRIIPIPDELASAKHILHPLLPNPNVALREWRIQNWGTPSNIESLNYFLEDKSKFSELSLYFDTCWTPPIPAITVLSRKFSELHFVLTYWMEDARAGIFSFMDGKTSCDESDDSHSLYHHVMSNNCLSIRDEDVECNLKKEGKLDIEGYAYISDTVMRLLSKHTGHIDLWSLRALSDGGALALGEHDGPLSFGMLSYLTDGAAKGLATNKGDLLIGGITELSDEAAESLAKHTGSLWLNDVKTLSDAAVKLLATHSGALALFGLKNISVKATAMLAAQKVLRSPSALPDLSDYEAESLSVHDGPLSLDGLRTLSDEAAQALGSHKGDLSLNSLTALTDGAAEALVRHEGPISLNGLLMVSPKAAMALIGHGLVKTTINLDSLCKRESANDGGGGNQTGIVAAGNGRICAEKQSGTTPTESDSIPS